MSLKNIKYGISYGRVSTFDQAFNNDGSKKDDASPAMQKFRCEQYINTINTKIENVNTSFVLLEHLSDDGFSAKNTNRKAYQELISQIKSDKINFIIATELSRLSRNTLDFLQLLSLCEKHKVDIIIIGLNLDTSSAFGKVIVTILVSLAQFEREMTSSRVKANAKARLISDGKINGTSEVLGLDQNIKKRGHFIINEEEVERLVEVLNIFLVTNSKIDTFREIQRLNLKWKRDEVFSKSRFNSTLNAIEYRYRGVWPLNRQNKNPEFAKLPHGPVVSLELLDKVQEKLNSIKGRKRKIGINYTYLLSTLLVHEDGSRFTGQPAKKRQYRYYYNKKNDVRIRCDDVDSLIEKRLNDYLLGDAHFKKLILDFISKRTSEIPGINKEIKKFEKALEDLYKQEIVIKSTLLNTQGLTNEETIKWLEAQVAIISSQKTQAKYSLESLGVIKEELLEPVSIDYIKNSIKNFLGQFKKLSNSSKRAILEKIFKRIVIKSSEIIELHIYDDVFKEGVKSLGKNITTSSTCGYNGGSNKT